MNALTDAEKPSFCARKAVIEKSFVAQTKQKVLSLFMNLLKVSDRFLESITFTTTPFL